MAKILVSGGFGAGWSTWMTDHGPDGQKFALGYRPLIAAIEAGEPTGSRGFGEGYDLGSPLHRFVEDYTTRFGHAPYVGGARDLEVVEVDRPFRVHEYDGSESIEFLDPATYFSPADFDVIEGTVREDRGELPPGEFS